METSFFSPPGISLHIFLYLRLLTEALLPTKEHHAETKTVAVFFGSQHAAHKPHSVLDVLLAENIVSGAGLISRTATLVWGVGQHQVFVLGESRARLQLMLVLQLIEKSRLDCAILSHGYLYYPKTDLASCCSAQEAADVTSVAFSTFAIFSAALLTPSTNFVLVTFLP